MVVVPLLLLLLLRRVLLMLEGGRRGREEREGRRLLRHDDGRRHCRACRVVGRGRKRGRGRRESVLDLRGSSRNAAEAVRAVVPCAILLRWERLRRLVRRPTSVAGRDVTRRRGRNVWRTTVSGAALRATDGTGSVRADCAVAASGRGGRDGLAVAVVGEEGGVGDVLRGSGLCRVAVDGRGVTDGLECGRVRREGLRRVRLLVVVKRLGGERRSALSGGERV